MKSWLSKAFQKKIRYRSKIVSYNSKSMSVKATIGCCCLNAEEKSEIALVLPHFAQSPSQPVFGMRRRLPCSIIGLGKLARYS